VLRPSRTWVDLGPTTVLTPRGASPTTQPGPWRLGGGGKSRGGAFCWRLRCRATRAVLERSKLRLPVVNPSALLSFWPLCPQCHAIFKGRCKFLRRLLDCCDHCHPSDPERGNAGYRRALWLVLGINAAMFLVEIGAGLAAGSASLQADALDFLGDAANYGISLFVVGMALRYRAMAALAKGL